MWGAARIEIIRSVPKNIQPSKYLSYQFPWSRVPSSTLNSLRGCWRSIAIVAWGSISIESESEVTQSCPTLCDPTDCSPPGSSIHEIFQTREDLEIQNLFLKTSNYLKTCPTRFPGAQSASLHPELPQGLFKVNSYSSIGFNLRRGRWQMSFLFSHWQCSW